MSALGQPRPLLYAKLIQPTRLAELLLARRCSQTGVSTFSRRISRERMLVRFSVWVATGHHLERTSACSEGSGVPRRTELISTPRAISLSTHFIQGSILLSGCVSQA